MKLNISVEVPKGMAFEAAALVYYNVKKVMPHNRRMTLVIEPDSFPELGYSSRKLRPKNCKRVTKELEYGKYKELTGYHALFPYVLHLSYLEQKVDCELVQRVFNIEFATAHDLTEKIIKQVCIDGKKNQIDNAMLLDLLKEFEQPKWKTNKGIPTYYETEDTLFPNVLKTYDPDLVEKIINKQKVAGY